MTVNNLSAQKGRHSCGISLVTMVKVAVMSGLAAVLMLFVQIPLLPAAPFLTYDLSDIPALLVGFALGPLPGVAVVLVKNAIFIMLRPLPAELIGIPMNSCAGCILVWFSSCYYWRHKSLKSASIGLVIATLAMTVLMIPGNYFVYPLIAKLFGQVSVPDLGRYVLLLATPFNFLKGLISGVITFVIYKRLSGYLKSCTF